MGVTGHKRSPTVRDAEMASGNEAVSVLRVGHRGPDALDAPITNDLRHRLEETAKDPNACYEPGDVARLATEILHRCANHRDRGVRHASLRVWKSPPSAPRA